MKANNLKNLDLIAKKIRKIVSETIVYGGKGNIGGALSCIDLLVPYIWKVIEC